MAVLTAVLALSLTTSAGADHTLLELVSPGTGTFGSSGPSGAPDERFGVTPDGSRLFFVTWDRVTAEDTDDLRDIYQRTGGTTTLVTTPPVAGTESDVFPQIYVSDDSRRVFFTSVERHVAADTDDFMDVYEWMDDELRLVTPGTGSISIPNRPNWFQLGADGSRVFIETLAQLVPEDTDTLIDIYEFTDGDTRLVTRGTPEEAAFPWVLDGRTTSVSAAGSQLVFQTTSALVAEDTDGLKDSYLWNDGAITLASTGPGDTHTSAVSEKAFMARDGTIVFETAEPLVPEDTDTMTDTYSRANGVTTLRSRPAPGGSADAGSGSPGPWISADGSHVYFHSRSRLAPEDTDNQRDVYENVGGTTRLVSTGAAPTCPGVPSSCDASLGNVTPDGTHVIFTTGERLVPEDTDSCSDAYERVDGVTTRLVTAGPTETDCWSYSSPLISDDGERIVFEHDASLVADDRDDGMCVFENEPVPCRDVYERHAAVTTLLSTGPIGGAEGFHASFAGMSDNGAVVAFGTGESLLPADSNGIGDVYVRRLATGHARPKSANSVQVSLVPAYEPCTAPNREHGPPLAFGSCAPPAPGSSHLMVGVGDGGHPAPARSTGFVRLKLRPGVPGGADDTTGGLRMNLTNVMRTADLSEYTGELRGSVRVRITDKQDGASQTVQDLPLEWTVPCVPTDSTSVASECDLASALDALVPGATPEGTRAIWALDQVRVYDGGADEDADTEGDNALFAVQGVFVP